MRGRAKKERDNKNTSQPGRAEMCGHRWQKLFAFHFHCISSCVNRLQLSFVKSVGRRLCKLRLERASAQVWMLVEKKKEKKTNKVEPSKQTHNTQPRPISAWDLWPRRGSHRDGEMSEGDRMERKLDKEWEITRCLWKTPLRYVPPSSH